MTISIALGWWLVPLFITLISCGCFIGSCASYRSSGGLIDIDVKSMGVFVCGLVASLTAWLIWALLT